MVRGGRDETAPYRDITSRCNYGTAGYCDARTFYMDGTVGNMCGTAGYMDSTAW